MYAWLGFIILQCGIPSLFLKCIIKEYNLLVNNFKVEIVDCSYMFRLLQSNHHQAVYQKYKTEIIFHVGGDWDVGLTKIIAYCTLHMFDKHGGVF